MTAFILRRLDRLGLGVEQSLSMIRVRAAKPRSPLLLAQPRQEKFLLVAVCLLCFRNPLSKSGRCPLAGTYGTNGKSFRRARLGFENGWSTLEGLISRGLFQNCFRVCVATEFLHTFTRFIVDGFVRPARSTQRSASAVGARFAPIRCKPGLDGVRVSL